MRNAPPVVERDRPVPGKKNTRRWCRGKVGREHQWEVVDWWQLNHSGIALNMPVVYLMEFCPVCGKHGRWLSSFRHDDAEPSIFDVLGP